MMPALAASLICFALMLGGMLLGMALRPRLPDHHLRNESADAVKVGTALIATLTALVLGLLIASAKANFETLNDEVERISAKILQLDSVLADYGKETREARNLLRSNVASAIHRLWPEEVGEVAIAKVHQPGNTIRDMGHAILRLSPRNEAQRYHKTKALQLNAEIADTRWLLVQQVGRSSLPRLAGLLIVFWLTFLFFSFGLFSPRNAMVLIVFTISALSAAGALLLILELDQPYHGIVRISSEPLRHVLANIGR